MSNKKVYPLDSINGNNNIGISVPAVPAIGDIPIPIRNDANNNGNNGNNGVSANANASDSEDEGKAGKKAEGKKNSRGFLKTPAQSKEAWNKITSFVKNAPKRELRLFQRFLAGDETDLEEEGDRAYQRVAKKSHWFEVYIFLSTSLSFSEIFLIAYPQYRASAQVAVLAASTLLWFIGYGVCIKNMRPGLSFFDRLREAWLKEVYIELFCFCIGWGFIFTDAHAFAAMRCFRIFRFAWYSKYYLAQPSTWFYPVVFFSHIIIQYLERVGTEIFTIRLSKGSVVVLGFFFYISYIMGVVFWLETQHMYLPSPEGGSTGHESECDTLANCFFIMIRLAFYDGSGFDFLKSLIDTHHEGQATLLIFYMCISAMVLLNGLIGIFGGAFDSATESDAYFGEQLTRKERELSIESNLSNVAGSNNDVNEAANPGGGGVGGHGASLQVVNQQQQPRADLPTSSSGGKSKGAISPESNLKDKKRSASDLEKGQATISNSSNSSSSSTSSSSGGSINNQSIADIHNLLTAIHSQVILLDQRISRIEATLTTSSGHNRGNREPVI